MSSSDHRLKSAKYYAMDPAHPDDFPFYRDRIFSADTNVLELGCGTGRVLAPLASYCGYIHGIDLSEAMLTHCQQRLDDRKISSDRATIQCGDITNFALNKKFDLITAPFRVLQNLETREQIDGLFKCIKSHLAEDGRAILNIRNPTWDRDKIIKQWCNDEEEFCWELETTDGLLKHYYRRANLQVEPLVLFPELIYRVYKDDELVDETLLKICQHCFFSDEFIQLIESYNFSIVETWGGYNDENYGEGDMSIVEFKHCE